MNEQESTPRRVYARPADRSLAAYKDFLRALMDAMNPGAADGLSEEWWEEAWREFWASADAASEPGRSTRGEESE